MPIRVPIAGEPFAPPPALKAHLGGAHREPNTRNRVKTVTRARESGLMR